MPFFNVVQIDLDVADRVAVIRSKVGVPLGQQVAEHIGNVVEIFSVHLRKIKVNACDVDGGREIKDTVLGANGDLIPVFVWDQNAELLGAFRKYAYAKQNGKRERARKDQQCFFHTFRSFLDACKI